MTGYGPAVQSNKLDTVPYFESDQDDTDYESFDEIPYEAQEYNGPMEVVT